MVVVVQKKSYKMLDAFALPFMVFENKQIPGIIVVMAVKISC